jgi:hypothetical protein
LTLSSLISNLSGLSLKFKSICSHEEELTQRYREVSSAKYNWIFQLRILLQLDGDWSLNTADFRYNSCWCPIY